MFFFTNIIWYNINVNIIQFYVHTYCIMQCQAAIYARMEHKSLLRHHTQMVSTWTCNLSTPVERKKYVNYLFFYLNKAVIRNGVVKFCGKYKSSFVALLYNDNILQSFSFSGWLRKIYSIQILNLHKNLSTTTKNDCVILLHSFDKRYLKIWIIRRALKYSNK